jgi:hypothetical protein
MPRVFRWMPCSKRWRSFRGVPHRLELVRELHGVLVQRLDCDRARAEHGSHPRVRRADRAAAWRQRQRPALGRFDATRGERVDHIVLFGEAAEKIEKTLDSLGLRKEAAHFIPRVWIICARRSTRRRNRRVPATSYCFHRAARVSMSSRILPNEEKGLENGCKNFRK